ncbi:hypothetical protein F4604DRAFT_1032813 [Suillus subluteus]|nr:hypothetical protein F4604DRAFT_1032813 [Suillus subluteus]
MCLQHVSSDVAHQLKDSLTAASGPSLMAAVVVLPPMLYDERNLVYQKIVEAAQQHVLDHAINVCSMLCDLDINQLVRETLGKAASSYCHNQKFGDDWATANLEVSFTRLSAPFELIMATCKTLARSKVERGYHLRPSAWSSDSESDRKKVKVKGLVGDHTSPLKYIFRKDEETDKWCSYYHYFSAYTQTALKDLRRLHSCNVRRKKTELHEVQI